MREAVDSGEERDRDREREREREVERGRRTCCWFRVFRACLDSKISYHHPISSIYLFMFFSFYLCSYFYKK
jgi:hypothetical protein